jgi:hypothetical protein
VSYIHVIIKLIIWLALLSFFKDKLGR